MQETKNYSIIYIGLHPETLYLLNSEPRFVVFGVNLLEYFFSFKTCNPVNLIFKLVYFLRTKETCRILEIVFFKIFWLLSPLSTATALKYKEYLKILVEKKMFVLDAEEEEKFVAQLKELEIDLIVVNSWGMLSENIIHQPKFGTVNIHPSKLPKYRGAIPTLWSLKNGDSESAVSYMILSKGADTGKIISQHVFSIASRDNALDIENSIDVILRENLVSDVLAYLDGRLIPSEQNELLASKTEKYEPYRKIDWTNERAIDIYNKIILYPFIEPEVYCFFMLGDKKIEVKSAQIAERSCANRNLGAGERVICFPKIQIGTKDGIIDMRLFADIGLSDSVRILLGKS